uniref:Negative elongation factor complex member C/D n=1 Tax=Phasianus colchicus TaxID=9054 RepID=A0A669NZD1_PHACC
MCRATKAAVDTWVSLSAFPSLYAVVNRNERNTAGSAQSKPKAIRRRSCEAVTLIFMMLRSRSLRSRPARCTPLLSRSCGAALPRPRSPAVLRPRRRHLRPATSRSQPRCRPSAPPRSPARHSASLRPGAGRGLVPAVAAVLSAAEPWRTRITSRAARRSGATKRTEGRYFQAGGSPENVIQLLSENYTAVAQTVNLLAEWLIQTGVEPVQVQETVENHLKSLLIKHFDPRKADSIFTEEGETPAWLEQMIAHTTWRDLFYKLAEAHPDCLMLNFTVKLISDAGYQGEITSVSTACQQLEVFSRVLRTSLATILDGGEENLEKNLPEFAKMVCHGEHTYLFAQSMMSILAQEEQGGSAVRRIAQEVQRYAHEKGHDASQITLALGTAASYPRACQALGAMLSKGALNPADITVLFKMFTSMDPPPVELIRVPAFLDLFMQSLFKPGAKINQDHKHKYIHILAYAASVVEMWKKNKRVSINKDELKSTSKAIETVHNLCCNENKGASELVAELSTLYQCIRFPVVAMGVLKWVDWTVSEPRYFQLQTDHTPVHLALLDEISTCHQLLHPQVLQLLVKLFETEHSQLDVMEQLELKKTLLDRMVHLLSRGYVLPVVSYIRKCLEKLDTDISLIRYFVTEVLDVIAPPYTSDFVQLFLPILENESIAGTIKTEGEHDPVTEFIAHCKSNFIVMN